MVLQVVSTISLAVPIAKPGSVSMEALIRAIWLCSCSAVSEAATALRGCNAVWALVGSLNDVPCVSTPSRWR